MKFFRLMILRLMIVGFALWGTQVLAQSATMSEQDIRELVSVKVRSVEALARHPVFVRAVERQNAQRLGMDTIRARDRSWTSNREQYSLIVRLQNNEAGELLRTYVSRNDDLNEAFLTDNQGANVAVFPPTSDYWQGDEEKWTASYDEGRGKTFIGPIERDESTQTYAVQVSAPVRSRGQTIGVLVVGVTMDYFEAKRASR